MSYAGVIKNTIWNLGGTALPILVAILTIPKLIHDVGPERFGSLAIGWAVMGYFAVSDLGIGRATTKLMSEFGVKMDSEEASILFWTSLFAHTALGLIGGGLFALFVPLAVGGLSAQVQVEAIGAFYWLAASIPLLLITSCFRCVLEARGRFDLVNILKFPASTINYLLPLLVLSVSNNLENMVAAIFIGRALALIAHAAFAFRVFPTFLNSITGRKSDLKRLFKFGIWAALSSLINPVALFADRFFVASVLGMAAVTYYVTPYEMVTKLWILSASVLSALYPILSATDRRSPELAALRRKAILFLVLSATPIVGVIFVFVRDFLGVWISPEFAVQTGSVAKWLALGVFFNVLAQVPFTILQATGRVGHVARMQLLELPIFVVLAWWLSREHGTVGVAMAWATRAFMDAVLLEIMSRRWMGSFGIASVLSSLKMRLPILVFLATSWGIEKIWRDNGFVRSLCFSLALSLFAIWLWRMFLTDSERLAIGNYLRQIKTRAD